MSRTWLAWIFYTTEVTQIILTFFFNFDILMSKCQKIFHIKIKKTLNVSKVKIVPPFEMNLRQIRTF